MNSPDSMDESTFTDSTLQPPPMDDGSTLASESHFDTPISKQDVRTFEIGNMQEDEETGPTTSDPNQHSLPDPEELKVSQGRSAFHGCGKMMAWMFLILALLIALTVGLVVGLQNQEERQQDALMNSGNSFTPVMRPEVEASMKDYIIVHGVSSESDFTSSTSPQSKALDFLAHNDPLQMNAPLSGLESEDGYKFITRYVMSLFYAALGGETWNYDLLFNSKHETCQWYDVFRPPIGQVGVLCNIDSKQIVGLSFSKFCLVFM